MKAVHVNRRESRVWMYDDSHTILGRHENGGIEWDTVIASDVLRAKLVHDLRLSLVWDDEVPPDTERPVSPSP